MSPNLEINMLNHTYIYLKHTYILVYMLHTMNLRNQLFPGILNPLRESGEFLKFIEISRNP